MHENIHGMIDHVCGHVRTPFFSFSFHFYTMNSFKERLSSIIPIWAVIMSNPSPWWAGFKCGYSEHQTLSPSDVVREHKVCTTVVYFNHTPGRQPWPENLDYTSPLITGVIIVTPTPCHWFTWRFTSIFFCSTGQRGRRWRGGQPPSLLCLQIISSWSINSGLSRPSDKGTVKDIIFCRYTF